MKRELSVLQTASNNLDRAVKALDGISSYADHSIGPEANHALTINVDQSDKAAQPSGWCARAADCLRFNFNMRIGNGQR